MLDWRGIVDRMSEIYDVSSQKELAERLGVSDGLISRWKAPHSDRFPTLHILAKVVEETGAGWEWLLTGKNDGVDFSDSNSRVAVGKEFNQEFIELLEAHRELVDLLGKLQISAMRGEISQKTYGMVLFAAVRGAREMTQRLHLSMGNTAEGG